MADLVVRIRGDVDDSELKGFSGTNEELAKKIKSVEAAADDLSGKTIAININTTVKGSGQIKDVIEVTETLDTETAKLTKTIGKLTNAEAGSVASSRALVATLTQQLNAVETGSFQWTQLRKSLADATSEYNQARGIQEGSITQLKQQNSLLQQTRDNTKLSGDGYRVYTDAINANSASMRRLQGIQEGSITDLQAIRRETLEALNATNRFTDPTKYEQLKDKLGEVERNLSALTPAAQRFAAVANTISQVRVVADTIAVAFQAISSAINTFVGRRKQIESFQLALENVGLSTAATNRAFNQAAATAAKLGAPLQAVEKSYQRMVPSLRSIGVTASESDQFIENLAARTQTLGLNTEQTGRFVEAFAQVLSKGKLSGEELNQQISELDGAFRSQLADALGITTQELVKFVESGSLGANQFVDAFNRMQNGVDGLANRVATGNQTIQQLQNQINNLSTENIQNLGAAFEPFFREVLKIQVAFAQFVNEISQLDAIKQLGQTFAQITQTLGAFIQAITTVISVVLKVLDPFVQLSGIIANFEVLGVSLVKVLTAVGTVLVGLKVAESIGGIFKSLGERFKELGITTKNLKKGFSDLIQPLRNFFQALKPSNFSKSAAAAERLNAKFKELGVETRVSAKASRVFSEGLKTIKTALTSAKTAALAAKVAVIALKAALSVGLSLAIDAVIGLASALFGAATAGNKLKDEADLISASATHLANELSGATTEAERLSTGGENIIDAWKFSSIQGGIEDLKRGIAETDAVAKKFTTTSNGITNATSLTNDELLKGQKALVAQTAARKQAADAIQAEIDGLDESNPKLRGQIQALEKERDAINSGLASKQKQLDLINNEITYRTLQGEKIGDVDTRLRALGQAAAEYEKRADAVKIIQQALAYDQVAKGMISVERAQARILGAELGTIDAGLKIYQQQLTTLEEKLRKQGQLNATEQQQYNTASENTQKLLAQQLQAEAQKKAAIDAAFDSGIQKARELGSIAGDVAAGYTAAFQSLSQAAGSAISAGLNTIGQISSAVQAGIDNRAKQTIAALERSGVKGEALERAKARIMADADYQRRAAIAYELIAKSKLAQLEYQVNSQRLANTTKIKVLEAEIAQLKLETDAKIARRSGDESLAVEYERAAAAYDEIIQAIKQEVPIQQGILDLQYQGQQAAIATAAASNDIQGFPIPDFSSALSQTKNLVTTAASAAGEYGNAAEEAKKIELAFKSKAFKSGVDAAQEVKTDIKSARSQSELLVKDFQKFEDIVKRSKGDIEKIRSELEKINNMGRTGVPARAMGGPVSAGNQYIVNDGGGREAFVNTFGRMSMLPAGRNIKWTAPTSGFVIPAHMVDKLNKDVDVQNNIKQTSAVSRIRTQVSGNLIKRSSTNMATSSQSNRIVNHVTIQSQTPVTDASRLMTQIARIKGRRRL